MNFQKQESNNDIASNLQELSKKSFGELREKLKSSFSKIFVVIIPHIKLQK